MRRFFLSFFAIFIGLSVSAQTRTITSPDGKLKVNLFISGGIPQYSVDYNNNRMLEKSPLGINTDVWDLTKGLTETNFSVKNKDINYSINIIKKSNISDKAVEAVWSLSKDGKHAVDIEFVVKNNDIAFRYALDTVNERRCAFIFNENTGWNFPTGTTTFFSKQMKGQSGWARTAPSYELPYETDKPAGEINENIGFIFPGLVKINNSGWVLFSETGVSSAYCASHFNCTGGTNYRLEFPMNEDFNFNGTSSPGIPLPGKTPWRTITVGDNLKPIAETSIMWDVVEPLYQPTKKYEYGAGTWSWIIGFDESVTYKDQKEYIDFTAAMGFKSVLVDNWWDTQIGHDSIEILAKYAKSKGVGLFLWYNSNGYWNDAPQGPRNIMNNLIARHKEMKWMQSIGIKGIKVDFFGSDKQQTMQLYEDIIADANEYSLQVIFHGCTLPRGWEKMYPNFIGCEAVLASENLHFGDDFNKVESYNATIHPFIRNSVANMDYGGTTFNRYYNATNDNSMWGGKRVTSDVFQMAVSVLFQCPIQHCAIAPRSLKETEQWKLDFMKNVPTLWDEIKFIDGYPGKYLILARRHAQKWYVVAINAQNTPLKVKLDLSFLNTKTPTLYSDDLKLNGSVKQIKLDKNGLYEINVPKDGAYIFVN